MIIISVIITIIIDAITMVIVFYTRNQYNYLKTYYSFERYFIRRTFTFTLLIFLSLIMLSCSNLFFASHS